MSVSRVSVLIMLVGVKSDWANPNNVSGYCYTCFIEPIRRKMISILICLVTASLAVNALLMAKVEANKPPF